MTKKKKNEANQIRTIILAGIILLSIVTAYNSLVLWKFSAGLTDKIASLKEANRPAELSMTIITTDCSECFDISSAVSSLKAQNVKILGENRLSRTEAASLTSQYGVEKFPTIILKGEIDKESLEGFVKKGDALVFSDVKPPYVNASGGVKGLVNSILINDKGCSKCPDLSVAIQGLESQGVVFSTKKKVDFNTPEAKQIIKDNSLDKVPALLISKDVAEYDAWQGISSETKGDYFFLSPSAPYVNATTGKVRGLVNLTRLIDNSCADCYDTNLHKQALARFAIAILNETAVDISSAEGKALLSKYNITLVPTIVLTGDLGIYTSFKPVWEQVGTIEDDGAYVFRNMQVLNNVKFVDLRKQ